MVVSFCERRPGLVYGGVCHVSPEEPIETSLRRLARRADGLFRSRHELPNLTQWCREQFFHWAFRAHVPGTQEADDSRTYLWRWVISNEVFRLPEDRLIPLTYVREVLAIVERPEPRLYVASWAWFFRVPGMTIETPARQLTARQIIEWAEGGPIALLTAAMTQL